jgi:hypothetical protein
MVQPVKFFYSRLREKSPDDIKVLQKETNGDLTIYEYTVHEKRILPLHVHAHQYEIFGSFKINIFFRLVKTNTI